MMRSVLALLPLSIAWIRLNFSSNVLVVADRAKSSPWISESEQPTVSMSAIIADLYEFVVWLHASLLHSS